MVTEELRDQFHIGCLAAARACARELEERSGELRVLDVCLGVDEFLFRGYGADAVVPVFLHVELGLEGFHLESLHALLAGADVNAVAAAEAVEHVDGLDETHAGELLADCGECLVLGHGGVGHLAGVEHERTDGGVGADVCALVALDTVLFIPFGNEGCHTAFLVGGGAVGPVAVGDVVEVRYLEQVAVLGVDGAHQTCHELGVVVLGHGVVGQVLPGGINVETVVFAAAVNCREVLVDDVLTLLAV